MPRVAMMNWMRDEPIERTVERLARHGYEALEISGEPEVYDAESIRALRWTQESVAFLRRELAPPSALSEVSR